MDVDMILSTVSIEHAGVKICYVEESNQWSFELRGRQRFTATLKEAREAIDKPQPKPKRTFEPFTVWKVDSWAYHGEYTEGLLTSFDADGKHAWLKGVSRWGKEDPNGRMKASLATLLLPNSHNRKLLEALKDNAKAANALADEEKALTKKFEHPSPDLIPDEALLDAKAEVK